MDPSQMMNAAQKVTNVVGDVMGYHTVQAVIADAFATPQGEWGQGTPLPSAGGAMIPQAPPPLQGAMGAATGISQAANTAVAPAAQAVNDAAKAGYFVINRYTAPPAQIP